MTGVYASSFFLMKWRIALLIPVFICVACFALAQNNTYPSRGIEVPASIWMPADNDRVDVVVMIHGHGGSRDESLGLPAIAAVLADRGLATIRMNFPGCSESTEPFTENNLTNMKADVLAAIDTMNRLCNVDDIGPGLQHGRPH